MQLVCNTAERNRVCTEWHVHCTCVCCRVLQGFVPISLLSFGIAFSIPLSEFSIKYVSLHVTMPKHTNILFQGSSGISCYILYHAWYQLLSHDVIGVALSIIGTSCCRLYVNTSTTSMMWLQLVLQLLRALLVFYFQFNLACCSCLWLLVCT